MRPFKKRWPPTLAAVAALSIAAGFMVHQTSFAHNGVCNRTQEVQDAILTALPNVSDCAAVTGAHLASITGTLDLSGQEIDTLHHEDLNGLTAVQVVDLSGNDLDLIPPDLFGATVSLEEMLVNDNELTRLPTNPRVTNDNLLRIDASNNAIGELHAGAFPYPNLRYVDLSNNSIERLNGDEFDTATRIEEINLENNQLHEVAASWHGAGNLQTLRLAGNPGAPFEIPVSLDDLGGAVFQVSIETGAPFPLAVELSATNGALSHGAVAVPNDAVHSHVLRAVPSGAEPVTVSIDSADFARGTRTGIVLTTGPAVSIDASSAAQGVCGRTRQIQEALSAHFNEHCSTIDEGQLSHIDGHFAVVNAGIENFKTGDLAGLTSVDDLYLYGNQVSELPDGFFSGAGNFKRVLLQDNPGADFPLNLSVVRKADGSMAVAAREGTPFIIRVTLEADGGALSERVLYVYGGNTESRSFSTQPGQPGGTVNVRIAEAKFQDEWQLLKHSYHDGFYLKVAGHEEQEQDSAVATPDPTPAPTPAPASPPPAPTNLTGAVNGDGAVTLSWNAPADDTVTGYQILRRRPLEGEPNLLVYVNNTGSTVTTYTDAAVIAGTRYVYRVKAINDAGEGARSNYVRVEP